MNFIRSALNNRQVVYLLMSIAVIMGLHSLVDMPRREDPKITMRYGIVLAGYPGATAQQVEAQVTRKIEPLLFHYAEVKKHKTYTTTRAGSFVASIELHDWVDDPDRFWAMLRHDLNELRVAQLPQGVRGPSVNSNFGDVVAVLLTIRGERYGSRELKDYLDQVDDALRSIPEVSKINRYGEQPEELAVNVRPARLAELGLTMSQIDRAISERNTVRGAGSIDAGTNAASVRPTGLFSSEQELREVVIGTSPSGQVLELGDVATIDRRYADPDFLVKVDGQSAMLMSIEVQDSKNIVTVGVAIHAKIDEVRKSLPSDLEIDFIADQPTVVEHRVADFGHEFIIAVVSVILVTVVLLPLRVAAMAAIAIPVTVAVTLFAIDALGIELHQISFAGLVVALGMVVDDAIVVVDNYIEKLDHGLNPFEAALHGTTELAAPVLGATLTIVASFLPLGLMLPGTTGEFIRAMPLSVAIALICSYVVAMLLTPLLAMAMIKTGLKKALETKKKRRSPLDLMQSGYEWLMAVAMPRKAITLVTATAAFVVGVYLIGQTPTQFFPSAERNQFTVDVWTPEGTRVESTDSVVQRVATVIGASSDVTGIATFVGQGAPRFYYNVSPELSNTNYGQLLVTTTSAEITPALAADFHRRLPTIAPEARVYVKELQQGAQLFAPIEVRLSGDDVATLRALSDTIRKLVQNTPGSDYVKTDWHEDVYGVGLTLRHEVASRLGLSEQDIAQQLAAGHDGSVASTFWEGSRKIAVRLRYDEASRSTLDGVGNAYVISPVTRGRVPVREVADLAPEWQQSRIVRRNGVRTVTIGSFTKTGVLASEVLAAVRPQIEALDLPTGFAIGYGGELENQKDVEGPMGVALGVSLLGIFLVLFFQFRNIKHPLIVMVSIPLALFGSALGLVLTGYPFGFTAELGIIALTGVVVRNAIILVDYMIEQRKHGASLDVAALEAGRRRLRPIFLTTMAAAAGVAPMIASGSSLWGPLASVLAVGLVCSMVFTLVVVPILFVIVERRVEHRAAKKAARGSPAPAMLAPAVSATLLAAVALGGVSRLALAQESSGGGSPTAVASIVRTDSSTRTMALTLDAAISMATTNSRVMRMAGARVQERVAAVRAARAELFPTIKAEAQYQGSTGNSSIEIPAGVLGTDGAGSPYPHEDKRIEQDGSQMFFSSLTMSQPLTQMFKIREGSLAAQAALMKSKADERGTALDVALAVAKLYLGTLVAERKQEAATALVVARRALLTDAQRQANTGMGLEAKVSEAHAGLLDAEQSLLTAEISADDARAELVQLLGIERDIELRLVMPASQGTLGSLDDYLTRATDRHPEVAAASADMEQATRGLRATKADYIPDVAVYAKHSYQDAVAFLPGNSFTAGIRASWDVLDFGRRRSAVEQKVATQRVAEENLANTREKVTVDVEKAYRNALRAERLVSVARQSLEARLAVERIAAGQTGAGLTLVSKQSEAAANRAAAESALVEAELGARIARAELAHAVGERLGSGSYASAGGR